MTNGPPEQQGTQGANAYPPPSAWEYWPVSSPQSPQLAPRWSPPLGTDCAVSVPHPQTPLPVKLHASVEELPGRAHAPRRPAPQT
eukprot:425625-Pleurochrysis_carterae.AAC.1